MSRNKDFDKFFKNFEKDMKSHVNKELLNTTHEIECPECQKKRKIKFKNGKGKCKYCNSTINLDLDYN
ncbi:hypothetical protein BUZ08_00135 [Staphylococcus gallinarum]|uniref:hypothetical protein n=1 Tax=Staphylococcus gallinarum TaxID=1293 RepID=UPI000D1D8B64|nr:hypothetical protein [Staphylococcus gallinarum]MCD8843616.1 hypothetical protein [Staphylococcus gallinarum]PTL18599.1 hypothetical protein BUZ08_00135 [Staphylococcus gallinarum]RIO78843.1 hypothetical protein BUZ07_09035 [Staphylococcus gallinarum]